MAIPCAVSDAAAGCDAPGLEIVVCHYPPGTSKWNKIEHFLFSFISINWRGRPLESYDTVVIFIMSTTTQAGLRVEAEMDWNTYETGTKIPDKEIDALPTYRHMFHGEWNYALAAPVSAA